MSYPSGPRLGALNALFSVAGRPTEIKVSFWIWFIGGLLGMLGGFLGMLASLVLFSAAPSAAAAVVTLMLLAAAVGVAQMVLAVRMKAGRNWARLALTALSAAILVLAVANAAIGTGQAGNWIAFLVSLVAAVLLWLPGSRAFFAAAGRRGNTSSE